MRSQYFISWLLVPSFVAATHGLPMPEKRPFTPPPYQALRFSENYSYLEDRVKRVDLFDSIKYIPFQTNSPSWYFTLGGELRERFVQNFDPNFGIHGTGSDSYWLQRATLLGDLHLGERFRVFAAGISGVIEGEKPPALPVQNDPIDLAYAFVDVVPHLNDDENLTLRVGRFGMVFGSGRLVVARAAPSAPNIPLRFDGFELLNAWSLCQATAFLTRPVEDNGRFSGSDPNTTFWGLYVTRWLDPLGGRGVDMYYLGRANEHARYASGSGKEIRHSFGARVFGSRNLWDWNIEGIFQVGTFGDQSILAWTTSVDGGYTWDSLWRPRLGLKIDIISGDRDSHDGTQGTFNALYPSPTYFNDASMIRPQNLVDVHPNLGVSFTRTVSVHGGADIFWRYSRHDAIYTVPGLVAIPALPTASPFVGAALDLNLEWKIQRHLTFGASYVHFIAGSYLHEVGGGKVNFVSTTLTFLF